ncbi:MAG: ABC transporter permease [Clostridiales bacterium]
MILQIALKDLRVVFLKDKQNLLTSLLMPIVLILILGMALGSSFKPDTRIENFTICVVNNDEGLLSKILINSVLRDDLSEMCETFVVDKKKAESMLKNKTATTVIYIPKDFSHNLSNNKSVEITINSQINQRFESNIIRSVVNEYSKHLSRNYSSAFAIIDTIDSNFSNNNTENQNKSDRVNETMYDIQNNIKFKKIDFKESKTTSNDISSLQYYSAAMLSMFILFSGINGSRFLLEEREKKTLERLKSVLSSKSTILFGKLLGLFFICLFQAAIMILFTSLIYKVNWGSSILGIIVLTLFTALSGASLSLFVATISKTAKSADGIGSLIVWTSTAVGGGMIPVSVMPKALKVLSNFTINNWIVKGYNSLMYGNSLNEILIHCTILLLMSIIYFAIGILKFKI